MVFTGQSGMTDLVVSENRLGRRQRELKGVNR